MVILNRRSLILGGAALLAAPAIVRAESLMKVAAPKPTIDEWVAALQQAHYEAWCDSITFGIGAIEYPRGGVPRAVQTGDVLFREGSNVDFIHAYDHGRINWNPPVPPLARKIVGEDWPSKIIRLRA